MEKRPKGSFNRRRKPGTPHLPGPSQNTSARWLALLFLGIAAFRLEPQEPTASPQTRGMFQDFLDDAGLRGRFVFDVALDPARNQTWFATAVGLHRYDGYSWERIDSPENPGASEFIRCLLLDRRGMLWLGTNRGGFRFDGTNFLALPESAKLAGPNIRRIVEDQEGILWFCCDRWLQPRASAGLTSYDGETWRSFGPQDGLPSLSVLDFHQSQGGTRYALTRRGLARLEGGAWKPVLSESSFPDREGAVWSLVEYAEDQLLLGGSRAFFLQRGTQWSRIPYRSPEPRHPQLLRTSAGRVIEMTGGTTKQLLGWTGREFAEVLSPPLSVPGVVEKIAEAEDGSLWCVGYDLLLRWIDRRREWVEQTFRGRPMASIGGTIWFRSPSGTTGLRNDGSQILLPPISREQTEAFLSSDTVLRWSPDRIEFLSREPATTLTARELGFANLEDACLDREHRIWLRGSLESGKIGFRHGTPEGFSDLLLLEGTIRNTRIDHCWPSPSGELFVVVAHPGRERVLLYSLSPAGVTPRSDLVLPTAHPVKVHGDESGRLWLYGDFGLFENGTPEWREVEGLPGRAVLEATNLRGESWFGTSGLSGGGRGLSRFREGRWDHYSIPFQRFLGRDPETGFVSTDDGLYRIRAATGEGPGRITLPDGITGTGTGVVREGNGFWIDLGERLFRFQPDGKGPRTRVRRRTRDTLVGEPFLLDVTADEWRRPSGSSSMMVSTRVGRAPWSAFSPLEPTLSFHLPVGQHEISVRTRDQGLDLDPEPVTVVANIFPAPIQSQWWFAPGLLGLFVVGSSLAAFSLFALNKVRLQTKRFRAWVASKNQELDLGTRKRRDAEREIKTRRDQQAAIAELGELSLGERELDEVVGRAVFLVKKHLEVDSVRVIRNRSTGRSSSTGNPQASLDKVRDPDRLSIPIRGQHDLYGWLEMSSRGGLGLSEDDGHFLYAVGNLLSFALRRREIESARSNLEERLRASLKIEALGTFSAGLAHDFNNLLTAILGYTEIAVAHLPQEKNQAGQAVKRIAEAAHQAASVTKSLLTFSRRAPSGKRPLDLNELVLGSVPMIYALLPPGIQCRAEVEENPLPWIHGDWAQLQQLLLNLAINARDAMQHEGILTIRVDWSEVEDDPSAPRRVRLSLRDTGVGMPEAIRSRVFDPFFTTKTREQGRGLGMSVVHGIVSDHGGTIEIRSSVGEGTQVILHFPSCGGPDPKESPPGETDPETTTILLAEEGRQSRAIMAATLSSAGYAVLQARTAAEAIELLEGHQTEIDLVIVHMELPASPDGETLHSLRKISESVPIIQLRDSRSPRPEPAALDRVFVLTQPFPTSELLRTTRDALAHPVGKASQHVDTEDPPR